MVAPETVRVAVFIDWQNVYMAARRAFNLERDPVARGNFSPFRLGLLLAAANSRGAAGQLVRVEVHRGVPAQHRDPLGYAANRRQVATWEAESPGLVVPRLRPLRYRNAPVEPPVEKGVDVALAVSAIEAMLTSSCDVAVLFSHDTDLLPVPETIARLVGPEHVETASWTSSFFKQRLQPKAPVAHHRITRKIFEAVETPVNFARPRAS